MTNAESTEYPYLLACGSHQVSEGEVCLLEAVSLGPDVRPTPGLSRTDYPHDVEVCRAAFGRSLNDAYGRGAAADIERTRDCWPLIAALRGTAARNDSAQVAPFLIDRALRSWYPRSLAVYAQVLRADGSAECCDAAALIDQVIDRLKTLPRVARADLAARAARAAEIRTAARDLRRDMAAALLETCQPGWSYAP